MDTDRRTFLTLGASCLAAGVMAPVIRVFAYAGADAQGASAAKRWGMVIDVNKCADGCTACVEACVKEHNIPNFGEERINIQWIRKAEVKAKVPGAQARSLLLLCNHCENPPCADVCPTGATFKRDDGIVLVDKHRCIGCRYCIISCPYNARSLVFKQPDEVEVMGGNPDVPRRGKGVVESCDFCVRRVDAGRQPACVEACAKAGHRALVFGDLRDPESEVARLVATSRTQTIRADLGTQPKVHYMGL